MMGLPVCAVAYTCIAVLSVAVIANAAEGRNFCDGDHTSYLSATCRQPREQFLQIYKEHNPAADRRNKVLCGSYHRFYNCMKPRLSLCPQVKKAFNATWSRVNELMVCACTKKKKVPTGDVRCLGEELHSVVYKRCDAYYNFQKVEKIYSPCKIAGEYFSCQHELMDSACGEKVAKAALDITRFTTPDTQHCKTSDDDHHTGFRYTEKCSPVFPSLMMECRDVHLHGKHLMKFHPQNDLIATGGHRELRKACRAFKIYTKCLSTVCEEGASLVYEMDGALRIYLTKVRYICDRAYQGYRSHLSCLQSVVANHTLNTCNSLFHSLNDDSVGLTAQAFYCGHPSAKRAHRTYDYLQNCFKTVYENKCGRVAGRIMADLMQEVRYDPYYFRYQFRARCANPTTTSASTKITPSSGFSKLYTPSTKDRTVPSTTTSTTAAADTTTTTARTTTITSTTTTTTTITTTTDYATSTPTSASQGDTTFQRSPSSSSSHSVLYHRSTVTTPSGVITKNVSKTLNVSNISRTPDSTHIPLNSTEPNVSGPIYILAANNSHVPLEIYNETLQVNTDFLMNESESRKRHAKSRARAYAPRVWLGACLLIIGCLLRDRHVHRQTYD